MKRKIKLVLLLILCLLLSGLLLACANPSSGSAASGSEVAEQNGAASVAGKWNIASVTNESGTMTGEELEAESGEVYYEFQDGGKFVAGAAGQEVLGSWEQNGAEVKVESNGESFTGIVDGDQLTIEANNATTVFTRE